MEFSRPVPRRHRRDARRLVGHARVGACAVRGHARGLRGDLPASCQRRAEIVVLRARMTRSLAVALNALGLYAIALVLAAAFAAQLLLGELPVPCACCSASSSRCWPWGPFSMSASGRAPATTRRRCWSPPPARLSPCARSCCTSCREIPAMARRCSAITITPGPSSALRSAIVAIAVMLLFDRQFEDDGAPPDCGRRVRAHRRVAGDRPHRART